MTDPRALIPARQKNYQLLIDACTAWGKVVQRPSVWGSMHRLVLAALVKAGGVVFADDVQISEEAATAAAIAFLEKVPTSGSLAGDVKSVDPKAVITAADEQRARDILAYWGPDFFVVDLAMEPGPQGPQGPQGPPGPPGSGSGMIAGAISFESLGVDDSQRTAAMNAFYRNGGRGVIMLPVRDIRTAVQVELWSALAIVGSMGVPTREYGTKTTWTYTGSADSVFAWVNNAGRYGYPSDGSPRDGTVIGVEFRGNKHVIPPTTTISGKTLWYWLFRDVGGNGIKSFWQGFGTGTTVASGVSHFQAFTDTVLDVGGSENKWFGGEYNFLDSKVIAAGKPMLRSRMEKSYIQTIMTTTRKDMTPLVIDGGRGLHVNGVSFDAQDSDPTNGAAIIQNSHDGLDVSQCTFKGMAKNGGPIIDIRSGRQAVIQSNAFLCKAAGPASTPLVKVAAPVGDRQVKFGLNSVVDYSGRLVAARPSQIVNIDSTLKVEVG